MNVINLAFGDRSLEEKYLETYRRNSIRTFLTYALWAAITVTGGVVVLSLAYQILKPVLYLYVIVMIALAGVYLHFRYFPPSYRMLEINFAMLAVIVGWLDGAFLIFLPQFQNYVWAVVAIHVVSSSLALPVRFLSAVVSQLLVVLGFLYIAIGLSDLAITDAFIQFVFLNGIASFCFYAAYWREKALRENFLQQEKITLYSQTLKSELEKGRKIQHDFLPTALPTLPHCDIAAYFHPAMQLSGDFYDVFERRNNSIGIVIADVSDKGVGSALFMALVRSLIRVFSGDSQLNCSFDNDSEKNPIALNAVSLTNEYITHNHGEEGMFATLFFGILDPSTGLLSYINGGHEPLIIVGPDGIKRRLPPTGPAVGLMPSADYKIGEAQLEHGDVLFGFTDGVTEARSPSDELYTRKRLEKSIVNSTLASASDFSDNVKSDLFKFIEHAPQSDDITMLAVRWGG
jgi:serine phosphatase RsbU (regulator of sigma subunit)